MRVFFITLNSKINFNLIMFFHKQLNNKRRLKIYDKYMKKECFFQIIKKKNEKSEFDKISIIDFFRQMILAS